MANPIQRSCARATDILGNGNPKIEPRWQSHFDRLIEMREILSERRAEAWRNGLAEQLSFSPGIADKATDEYDMGAAYSLLSSEQDAIYEVEQAIRRIIDGTYGICEATGEPIPEERLQAIPWTRFARDAEEAVEQREAALRPKHVF